MTSTLRIYDPRYPPSTGPYAVTMLGDSKTLDESWTTLLTNALEAKSGTDWASDIYAQGSTTLALAVANLATLLTHIPTGTAGSCLHVLVNLGANEMASMPSAATWKANYWTLIDAIVAQQPGALVYPVKPWYRGKDSEALTMAGWVDDVIAQRPTVTRLGHNEYRWLRGADDGATMTTDGVHYSAAGQTECTAQWMAAITI